jgi:hypothetical protein
VEVVEEAVAEVVEEAVAEVVEEAAVEVVEEAVAEVVEEAAVEVVAVVVLAVRVLAMPVVDSVGGVLRMVVVTRASSLDTELMVLDLTVEHHSLALVVAMVV